jgi:hypothetical protein
MMKQKICTVLFVLSVVLFLGIVGGVENGEPLTNLLWCIPIGVFGWICAVLSGLMDI